MDLECAFKTSVMLHDERTPGSRQALCTMNTFDFNSLLTSERTSISRTANGRLKHKTADEVKHANLHERR